MADADVAIFRDLLGDGGVLTDAAATAPYLTDERQRYTGRARAVLLPASTADVQALVRHCAAARIPIVPQGGNTGYCGGATPDSSGHAVLVSLQRMNRIRSLDRVSAALIAEAGLPLRDAQRAALDAGLQFPLSMGSEASAQLGGALSTNAGGLNVLRHGMAREQVLGLEVVLPDGALLSDLPALRKDNTGYDLKQLFIGAEGTLGIITCATLRLLPWPRVRTTVFAAVPDLAAACLLLAALRDRFGPGIAAFEYLAADALGGVLANDPDARHPLAGDNGDAVLMDLVSHELTASALQDELVDFFSNPAVTTLVRDAAVAASEAQRGAWWALRERVPAAERAAGGSLKHDISIEISRLPELARSVKDMLRKRWPAARLSVFGHVGDGNLHFNVLRGAGAPATAADEEALADAVHASVAGLGGSFSAEHGIGQLKRATLARLAAPTRLAVMAALKKALDPDNLMNPGKVL